MLTLFLSSVLFTGGAVAQLTAAPDLRQAVHVDALNPADQGYTICSDASQVVDLCLSSAEGAGSNSASVFVACACCYSQTDLAAGYYTCASYLASAEPDLTTAISAYATLYEGCSAVAASCSAGLLGGSGGNDGNSQGSNPPQTSVQQPESSADVLTVVSSSTKAAPASTSSSNQASVTAPSSTGGSGGGGGGGAIGASDTGSIIPTGISVTANNPPPACSSMVGLFESCVAKVPNFSNLPYGSQAPCYCCQTNNGAVTYTTALDSYAADCRDWASTGEPKTIYPVAETFASFCENFSDACSATQTDGGSGSGSGSQPTVTSNTGPVTVTVNNNPNPTTSQKNTGDITKVNVVILGVAVVMLL